MILWNPGIDLLRRRKIMERFKKIYQQGTIDVIEIWVDAETGV